MGKGEPMAIVLLAMALVILQGCQRNEQDTRATDIIKQMHAEGLLGEAIDKQAQSRGARRQEGPVSALCEALKARPPVEGEDIWELYWDLQSPNPDLAGLSTEERTLIQDFVASRKSYFVQLRALAEYKCRESIAEAGEAPKCLEEFPATFLAGLRAAHRDLYIYSLYWQMQDEPGRALLATQTMLGINCCLNSAPPYGLYWAVRAADFRYVHWALEGIISRGAPSREDLLSLQEAIRREADALNFAEIWRADARLKVMSYRTGKISVDEFIKWGRVLLELNPLQQESFSEVASLARERDERITRIGDGDVGNSLMALALHKTRYRLCRAAISLELARQKYGCYLLSTEEVQEFTDPWSGGRSLRYGRTGRGLKIYSVGPNGVDDGGTGQRDKDIVFELRPVPPGQEVPEEASVEGQN